jgi:cysteine-rich repeat protein
MSRRASVVSALAACLLLSSTASGFAPRRAASGPRALAQDAMWVAAPAAAAPGPLRTTAEVAWNRPARPVPWQRFVAAAGPRWDAAWDRATAVPRRIWGEGLEAPGASADPAIAAAFARAFLADHLALLAPGAAIDDFALVANVTDGHIRSVGFAQHSAGLRVEGGHVGFEFQHDRLFVIGSTALPDISAPMPRARLAMASVATTAAAATVTALGLDPQRVRAHAADELVVVPLIGQARVYGYRVAVAVDVDAGADGRWTVFADPASGAPLVRRQDARFAIGKIEYDAVVRYPDGDRHYVGAARVKASVNGQAQSSTTDGSVTWNGTAPASVTAGTEGDLVTVIDAKTPSTATTGTLAPDGVLQWSGASDEFLDAEIQTFVHAQVAKAYVRQFAPTLAFLDEQLPATVNINKTCNAYYSGKTVNFFISGDGCGNTGRLADVVYHEFGHGVHEQSVIAGVGEFEGAFSEGQADFLAAMITGDHRMGLGFYVGDLPLREIDPPDSEAIWPRDIGEIHATGLIYSGAMWDLRKQLIIDLGEPAAVALMQRLYLATLQRSTDIPAAFVEVLAADDDDGNLANGTPHECAIRAAFGRHGLRALHADATQLGSFAAADGQLSTPVDVELTGLSTRCPSDQIASITLGWQPRSGALPERGSAAMAMVGDASHWRAELPLPADGGIAQYQVRITFADGSKTNLPENAADDWYVLYQGETVPLYCTDFEEDPFAHGWTHNGNDDWAWGVPTPPSTDDPAAPFSGSHLMGTNLTGDGRYTNREQARLTSPEIDLGIYSDVHLQYRRWLTVADASTDPATILANEESAWSNLGTKNGENIVHQDREWVFQDVPLSGHLANNKLKVTFALDPDDGYTRSGWNIDDVCIVANAHATCGDGIRQGTEQCDKGPANADAPDVCRTYCRLPKCGDGIVDSTEECDDGNKLDGDLCTPDCMIAPVAPQGCCDAGGSSRGAAVLWTALGALAFIRRRRR